MRHPSPPADPTVATHWPTQGGRPLTPPPSVPGRKQIGVTSPAGLTLLGYLPLGVLSVASGVPHFSSSVPSSHASSQKAFRAGICPHCPQPVLTRAFRLQSPGPGLQTHTATAKSLGSFFTVSGSLFKFLHGKPGNECVLPEQGDRPSQEQSWHPPLVFAFRGEWSFK